MNSSFYLTLASFVFVLLIYIIYIMKEKIKTEENKLYFMLLNVTVFSIISETALAFLYSKNEFLLNLSMRVFLICTVIWISLLFKYLISLLHENKKIKSTISYFVHTLFYLIIILFTILLPVDYHFKNEVLQYSAGPAVNFAFSIAGVLLFIMIIM